MSIKKKSCLFVIALTALFFAAEALAQTPDSGAAVKTPAAKPAPQQDAKSGTATAAADAGRQPDAEEAGMVKDVMRNFRESYRLGPDDELSIKVLKQPDYSVDKVKVSPVGTIFHNLLGEIPVAGMTIDQLKKRLTDEFSEYVIDPSVYIELL
ncbi:MAG: polysaccharide biosynthesis/export family protein, partial [Blastocatellia bacterium]|nr:polysaccharide biosynthesis/export family protein [Blastocatellia bacterium]